MHWESDTLDACAGSWWITLVGLVFIYSKFCFRFLIFFNCGIFDLIFFSYFFFFCFDYRSFLVFSYLQYD